MGESLARAELVIFFTCLVQNLKVIFFLLYLCNYSSEVLYYTVYPFALLYPLSLCFTFHLFFSLSPLPLYLTMLIHLWSASVCYMYSAMSDWLLFDDLCLKC